MGISVSLAEENYVALNTLNPQIDAYMFCGNCCMQAVMAWAEQFSYRGPISYFFESADSETTPVIIASA